MTQSKYKIYVIAFVWSYICYESRDYRYPNKKTVMIYLLQLVVQLVHYHYMIKKISLHDRRKLTYKTTFFVAFRFCINHYTYIIIHKKITNNNEGTIQR